jgi:ankyrin repeat protein
MAIICTLLIVIGTIIIYLIKRSSSHHCKNNTEEVLVINNKAINIIDNYDILNPFDNATPEQKNVIIVNNQENSIAIPPLALAMYSNDRFRIDSLINQGFDARIKDNQNRTILHHFILAILQVHPWNYDWFEPVIWIKDYINKLLKLGVDINALDSNRCTALHYIINYIDNKLIELQFYAHNTYYLWTIVEVLLENGSNIIKRDKKSNCIMEHIRKNIAVYTNSYIFLESNLSHLTKLTLKERIAQESININGDYTDYTMTASEHWKNMLSALLVIN